MLDLMTEELPLLERGTFRDGAPSVSCNYTIAVGRTAAEDGRVGDILAQLDAAGDGGAGDRKRGRADDATVGAAGGGLGAGRAGGGVSGAAGVAVTHRTGSAAPMLRRRRLDDSDVDGVRRGSADGDAARIDAARLDAHLQQALTRCDRYRGERDRALEALATTGNECEALKRELAELKINAAQDVDFAASAAYDDAADRVLQVRRLRDFEDAPVVRDVLKNLAARFSSLAIDSKDEARAHRDKIFMQLTREEQQFWGRGRATR
jgi:hypothetical protein